MLRYLSYLVAVIAAGALGFTVAILVSGDASRILRKIAEPKSQLRPGMQVPNRASRGPALTRRDNISAALKADREPLFRPHIVRIPDTTPAPPPLPPAYQPDSQPQRTQLVNFESAPFPYRGVNPRSGRAFLNYKKNGRVGHRTGFGRLYWSDKTYSDNRVLLHMPPNFDKDKPGVIVMFFHGHGATLTRDVLKRQQVPQQISASGMNALLVAPQMAVNARDSSAGKLWTKGGTKRLLDEAAERFAEMYGDASAREQFKTMPVILVGYSGGYVPTAWSLSRGGLGARIKGVVLLDGLYGELGKFSHWISRNKSGFFLSAFAKSTKWRNVSLKRTLKGRKIPYRSRLAERLAPGSVTFLEVHKRHRHYVTNAWSRYPLADLLSRLPTTVPVAQVSQPATLASAGRP